MQDVIERITAAYNEEDRGPVQRRDDVPASYEAITPAWLSNILCAEVPGAEVTAVALDDPDDGSSNRRRIRLTYNEAGTRAGLPRSVFCKAAMSLPNRLLLGVSGAAHAEVTFYNELRPLLDIEASTARHAAYDPGSFAMIIVLDDIAGEVTFCDEATVVGAEDVESRLDLLARMHARFGGDPRSRATSCG